MPYSENTQLGRRGRAREARDFKSRQFALWLLDVGYVWGVPAIGVAAAAIASYAFTVGFGQGVRAVIFFVVPVLWGAFILAVNDGQPQVIEKLADKAVHGIAVVAALVIGSVMFLAAPISLADLALGIMTAFFFLMWISDQPTMFQRKPTAMARTWMLAMLIMVTIISVFVAVAL